MNIYLQIGLGLLPGAAVVLLLLFKRKAFQPKKILFTFLLTACCGGFLFWGVRQMIENAGGDGLSREETAAFANALFLEGAYEEAQDVMDQYSALYGYDDQCRLLLARISLMREDYRRADGLYGYLCEKSGLLEADAGEVEFAFAKNHADPAAVAMVDYLDSVGADIEAYGYTREAYGQTLEILQTDTEKVFRSIRRSIEDTYEMDDDMEDCARAVATASRADASSEEGQKECRRLSRVFEDMAEDFPKALELECVRKARLKTYALSGKFEEIAESLDQNSTYHELMVAAELYMSGLADTSDFGDRYQELDRTAMAAVKRQVDQVCDSRKGLSSQGKRQLRRRVDAIETLLDEPTLTTIKEQLMETASGEAGADRTKVYLEIAKIENFFGNEISTDNYLREAIYHSQECEDDSYVSAMGKIISVINSDDWDDMEDIKNVAAYVDTVLDHSLTVDVEAVVSSRNRPEELPQEEGEEKEEEERTDFARTAADYVSRARSAVTIGPVDTEKFEKITARVQISSDSVTDIDELKDALAIYDCGVKIDDFTLKKVEYESARIILCCDVSGSMSESIQDLQNAVTAFVNDRGKKEEVSIVTFSSGIEKTVPFGSSDRELLDFVETMWASGGTSIFYTVIECLNGYSESRGVNNVLIVMTDGQDGYMASEEEIMTQIGGLADRNAVTVYTMGLGSSVDTAYLNTIAGCGNGEFVYVSDSASLTAFFDMLHGQVDSQYELTYQAADTLTMRDRTLEVALPSENVRDVKRYSLVGAEGADGNGLEVSEGVTVFGVAPRYLYKGLQDVNVLLKGSGFTQESKVSIKLNGNIDYTMEGVYVDGETVRFTVPAGAGVDDYDVEVTVDGRRKVLQNGFSVIAPGDRKKTAFGPYVFTSGQKTENEDGSVTLRGAVEMNGWLHFKGDLVLEGDAEEDGSVRVTDESGSYVEFDPATAQGFGKGLAERGVALEIPALHTFRLYHDPQHRYDYSDYQVDDIYTGVLALNQLIRLDSPVLRLYPDSIGVFYSTGTTILPYQDQVLKNCGLDDGSLFDFQLEGSARITNSNIGVKIDMEYSDPDSDVYSHAVNFFNAPVYFNGSVKLKIDTLQDEYMAGAMIRMAFFAEQSGVGAELSWKGRDLESIKVGLELAQPVKLPTAFPLEMNDFSVGVSNLQSALQQGSLLKAAANMKITGSATVSSGKVSAYFPALEKFVGDISVLEMPDTTVSLRLSPLQVEADAKLVFLSEITLAQASVKLGNFEYTNALLGLDSQEVQGLSASLKSGITADSFGGRLSVDLSGTGELDAHSRFIGVNYTGTAAYDISWWILHSGTRVEGTVAFGLYRTHNDLQELVFAGKYQDSNGKIKGFFYYIDENGRCGSEKNGSLN